MAVDEINSTNPVLPTALQSRVQTSVPLAASPLATVKNPVAGPTETPFAIGTTTGGATTGVTSTTTTATPTVTTTPAAETTIARQGAPPTQQATTQPISYRNAFAVYEVRNPTPPPPDPMPTRKDLHPPLPIGRVRPVDPLVLRQEWEKRKKAKRKEAGRVEEIEPRSPMGEKAIRDLVRQANEDLAANGVPLHLVLVQNEEGFALDIYDSSDDAVCAVTQEVPLDLTHLLTILDNLEHEAGIIINIKT